MFAKANREAPYLSKKDRKVLAETAKRVFLSRNPNPNGKGCPDPSVLRSLAFRKPPKRQPKSLSTLATALTALEKRWATARSSGS